MVSEGCNLIVRRRFGLRLQQPLDAAKAHPDVNFALIDSALSTPDYSPLSLPNVKPLQYEHRFRLPSLAGYLAAAATTKTGKVATYGGMLFPSVTIFMDGFKQGVDLLQHR
jgi:basic membrane protein A